MWCYARAYVDLTNKKINKKKEKKNETNIPLRTSQGLQWKRKNVEAEKVH